MSGVVANDDRTSPFGDMYLSASWIIGEACSVFIDDRADGDSASVWFHCSRLRLERSAGDFRIPEAHTSPRVL
jgi:hypothetical protein